MRPAVWKPSLVDVKHFPEDVLNSVFRFVVDGRREGRGLVSTYAWPIVASWPLACQTLCLVISAESPHFQKAM
jgi:hypothetical protein